MSSQAVNFLASLEVPQLDGLIRTGGGQQLPVWTEGNCVDPFLVTA